MASPIYVLSLLALIVSNFFLSKFFLSPFLPSELKMVEAFFITLFGSELAQSLLKYDVLLLWLAANLILMQVVVYAYRKAHPYEGLPLGWLIFSFGVPFMAADYSFDYKNQTFGEYIDGRYRLLISNDSYPNRYGRQLVAAFGKKRTEDYVPLFTQITAPKLGQLPAYGTLSEGCVKDFVQLAGNFSIPHSFACEVMKKISGEKKSAFEMEASCFEGPAYKVIYALDQGGVRCPVEKIDLAHYTKICAFMKNELKTSPITSCRMLGLIPFDKIKTMMAPRDFGN